MSRLFILAAVCICCIVSLACGSGGSTPVVTTSPPASGDPLYLLSPNQNITVTRGDVVSFAATMPLPDEFTWVEFYSDLDDVWDNDNESLCAYSEPSASFTADWDTVSANPGDYHIAIVLYSGGTRVIGYAEIIVTVEGNELFELLSPAENATITRGDILYIAGILNSTGFTSVEFYLDPDASWNNDNEFLILTCEPDDIAGNWDSSETDVGTYNLVVVLYREIDRFIGYIDRTVAIEAVPLPSKQIVAETVLIKWLHEK